MRLISLTVLSGLLAQAAVVIDFNSEARRWELSNGVIRAEFVLAADGTFGLSKIEEPSTGIIWNPPTGHISSPIRVTLNDRLYSADTAFRLIEQSSEEVKNRGRRVSILLEDLPATVRIRVELEMFEGQSVLRQRIAITNLSRQLVYVTTADLLYYRFALNSDVIDVFHIDQWDPTTTTSFQLHRELLPPEGATIALRTGADARDIAWFAFRDQGLNGLFAGLEFDGRGQLSLERSASNGALNLSANIPGLNHPVEAGATFELPRAFLGPFHGDWDNAGRATQRFTDAVLAQPAPAGFPWVGWDSWGYGLDINEQILRDNAERAAKLGIEVFVVDLGWARKIGDWTHDPVKFPNGLRAISDYAHQLGMKFGIHFALADAAPDSPVLQEHPDWTASEDDGYFGARSLCLGNLETRQWVVREAVRMIDDYNPDYIVQDGENMVKRCRRSDHTHHPMDSNYANSVGGLNWVVAEIQRLRPGILWENCEDGGHMMTFQMVQQYVTSITNDATGALDSRKGVWGATYPFPARYTSRYMPEHPWTTYVTRSYMFGGPWHFMNRLPDMSPADLELGVREIAIYKQNRDLIRSGQVFHLLGAPAEGAIDVIESYDARRDAAFIVAVRENGSADRATIRPQGLQPERSYRVRYQDDSRIFSLSGQQLAAEGIDVRLPGTKSAEIVYIEPLQ